MCGESFQRMRARAQLGLLGACGALLVASAAHAHDSPFGTGLFFRDPQLLVRSNRGLIWSADGKSGFQLLCNEALGINTSEVPGIAARSDGRWVIASSHGVMLASADFCALQPVASLDAVAVPALGTDPSDAQRLYASTGQSGIEDGLFLSTDQGTTFATYGMHAQNRVYDHLLVSALDPTWLEVSGLRLAPDMASFIYFFGSSTDRGVSFTAHDFTLGSMEYGIALLGLHPKTRGTLFAAALADQTNVSRDRIMQSTDYGQSWKDLATVHRVEAFASDDTGNTLWVGARDGLWRSADAGKTWKQLQTDPVYCLARRGGRLYLCDSHMILGGVGYSDDGGTTVTSLLRFTQVTTQVSCPFDSKVAIACSGAWGDWQRELAQGFAPDGGVARSDASAGKADAGHLATDAGSAPDGGGIKPDGGASAPPQRVGCSCRVAGQAGATTQLPRLFRVLALLAGLGAVRRWRQPRGRLRAS